MTVFYDNDVIILIAGMTWAWISMRLDNYWLTLLAR